MSTDQYIERAGEVLATGGELAKRKGQQALAFVEEDPKRAALYVGGSLTAAYIAYRIATYPPPWLFGGVAQLGERSYRITNGDMLWLARMVYGETGGDDTARAAVLWSVLTRHMSKPTLYQGGSLANTIRMFSQVLSPLWSSPFGCDNGRGCCGSFWGACSPSRLMRRANIRWSSWYTLPAEVRDAVVRFASGELPNPVPGANNFAMSVSSNARAASVQAGFQPVTIRGNTFVRDAGSTPGQVRFV
jgi:hypothetical protein